MSATGNAAAGEDGFDDGRVLDAGRVLDQFATEGDDIDTVFIDGSQLADEAGERFLDALDTGASLAGIGGGHGAGEVDQNGVVVIGNGGHEFPFADEVRGDAGVRFTCCDSKALPMNWERIAVGVGEDQQGGRLL